jgi:hypothetical protein
MECLSDLIARVEKLSLARQEERQASQPTLPPSGLVYSFIGHRIGYSHSEEVSRCIHKRFP